MKIDMLVHIESHGQLIALSYVACILPSYPGSKVERERRAWYPLLAHALN